MLGTRLLPVLLLFMLSPLHARPVEPVEKQCSIDNLTINSINGPESANACFGVLNSKLIDPGTGKKFPGTDSASYLNGVFNTDGWQRDTLYAPYLDGDADRFEPGDWSFLSKIAWDPFSGLNEIEGIDPGFLFCGSNGESCSDLFPAGGNEQTAGEWSIKWGMQALSGISELLVAFKAGTQWSVYHIDMPAAQSSIDWDIHLWSDNALSHLSLYGRLGRTVSFTQASPVPSPGTLLLVLAGFGGLAGLRRGRNCPGLAR